MRRSLAALVAIVVAATLAPAAARAAVGIASLRLVDSKRTVPLPHGRRGPRVVQIEIRYPAAAGAARRELRDAPPRPGPRLPLVVFAHGYAVTPATYTRLLDAWADAGYVVAAPLFPRTSSRAPGGPARSDLPNQPGDVRLVISRVIAVARAGGAPWASLVDGARIAVAGHSDGAITALAVGFDRRERDPRVSAVVSLAGAFLRSYSWYSPRRAPALLAVQGTGDTTNAPANASSFFRLAAPPKYLLWLLGAGHLPPFTTEQRQLRIVERATTAFLDLYLKRDRSAAGRLSRIGRTSRVRLVARP